jgi:hypothetical protein
MREGVRCVHSKLGTRGKSRVDCHGHVSCGARYHEQMLRCQQWQVCRRVHGELKKTLRDVWEHAHGLEATADVPWHPQEDG